MFLNVNGIDVPSGKVKTESADIQCGSKIARQLKGSNMVALFIGTAGNRFDEWIRKKGTEDIMAEYYCSSIGSVIADKVADVIEDIVMKHASTLGMGITNRYSPGYCDWNIREQRMIFDLLPAGKAGVTLTQSFLMKPVKSVSGIIGIGPGLDQGAYMCEICGMTNCIVKKAKGY
jgi:cobalamin-dependent methionine synthase I